MSDLKSVSIHLALPLIFGTVQAACVNPYSGGDEVGDCIPGLDACMETGESEESGETGVEELDQGECVYNYNEDVVGYVHQCEGTVDFQIEFDIDHVFYNPDTTNCSDMQALIPDNQLCTESHAFGSESYEQPQVVACCGEYDRFGSTTPYLEACTVDLAEQACRMLKNRLEYHKKANHFPGFETQAQNVINYLAGNIGTCTGALIANDTDATAGHLDSYYTIPNNNMSWPVFDNFTIYVDIGDINSFDATGITCHGIDASDDNIFEKPQASIGGTVYTTELHSSMTATLDGPDVGGSPVSGSGAMTTTASCNSPWCSNATFEVNSSDFAIQEFNLFASSGVMLSDGAASYTLADVRIMLADAALGYVATGTPPVHTVAAGDAFFWLVGTDPYDATTTEYVIAVTSTDIEATYDSGTGVWSLDAFDIEYVDYNSDVWTITIPASSWD